MNKNFDDYCESPQENGRTDTLIGSINKIELLQKQLNIAIQGLKEYANRDNWYHVYKQNSLDEYPIYIDRLWKKEKGYTLAQKKLKEIEKLEQNNI